MNRESSMNRRQVLAGLALVVAACAKPRACPEPAVPVVGATKERRWDTVLRAFEKSLEDAPAPGGAIAVVVDGRPAFADARGVRKMGTSLPMTTSTLVRLESVTKTFTAILTLSLRDEKKLDLDAPIADLVPVSFADAEAGRKVTLRRLLTHTAGLARNSITRLREVGKGTEYRDLFAKGPLALGAQDRFEYSNTGYLLVGAAIERASGVPYAEFLSARVLSPLGIPKATANGVAAETVEHADGFGPDVEGKDRSFDPPSLDPYVQRSVGGLHASIDHFARFAAAFNAGLPNLLRPETFAEMTTKQVTTNEAGVSYGYGLYVADSPFGPIWTHTGAGQGSFAAFVCVPRSRFAVVATVNGGRYGGWRDVRRTAEEAFLGSAFF